MRRRRRARIVRARFVPNQIDHGKMNWDPSSTRAPPTSLNLPNSAHRDRDAKLDGRGDRPIVIERGKEPPPSETFEKHLVEARIIGRLAQLGRYAAIRRDMENDDGDSVEPMLTERVRDRRHRLEDGTGADRTADGR